MAMPVASTGLLAVGGPGFCFISRTNLLVNAIILELSVCQTCDVLLPRRHLLQTVSR